MDIFDLPAPTLTMIGVLAGYLMIEDLNADQQNALGNLFILIGQILETNASFLINQQSIQNSDLIMRISALESQIEILRNKYM